ncbi:uncharacterized protein LOC121412774 [Lytechinus variegatus]|uniref:uncharacterized protein LOC121412774 n=1 Tax=Lytechinus variegatus TaxID=7654 RepID=UPI001BB28433|nr:uncharacterized protein LOC121412774 [Lytechinus variegatus]
MSNAYNMFTFVLCFIILIVLSNCESVHKIQGENVTLHFPYPCDNTEVTLQQSNRRPFYRSTFGPDLILLQLDQVGRFTVYDGNSSDSCYVDLMISNLMKDDEGTYILFVYKDGEILGGNIQRIYLEVGHPPGKASCVVGDEMDGDWVSLDCQANAGSLPGKIVCYQSGVWMPTLAGPTETGSLLKQTILIRQSGPVFCCSSLIDEDRERCECKDTSHYLSDGDYIDPCPTPSPTLLARSTVTTVLIPSTSTESNQSNQYSSLAPSTPIQMKESKGNQSISDLAIVFLVLMIILLVVVIVLVVFILKTKNKCNKNANDPSKTDNSMPLLNGHVIKSQATNAKHTENHCKVQHSSPTRPNGNV